MTRTARVPALTCLLSGLLFCALSCTNLWAQAAATAQISGVIKDQSGAVLPGAEVIVTQTDTDLKRTALTNETGSYVLTNLPTGPYRLEVGLPGFRTYVQTGIVLQVNSNPVVNAVLEVGQVAETVEVQSDVAMVETHSSGVGTVVDNQRVVEMPLNGRNATELIYLSGLANVSTGSSTSLNSTRNYPTVIISVAGGTGNGITYQLDGANHNDTQNSLNLPLPFPDALQEFKVETSALPAQYGYHSNAVVNAITKSGTNEIHGDAFEFLRNGALNARDFFAAKRDTLRRNQFGGVIGGPIKKDKLFVFGGYQGTIQKSDPQQTIAYVPTPEMLAGDFRTIASPLCNGGRQVTLATSQGFVNNQISPARFSPVTVKLASLFPATADPCGKVTYGLRSDQTEHLVVTKIDYQRNQRHSMLERFTFADLDSPSTYDGKNPLTVTGNPKNHARVYSLAVGDTYLIGSNIVSSFRAGVNRTKVTRIPDEAQSWSTLGAQNFTSPVNKISLGVSGNGFNTGTGGGVPVLEHSGPNTNVVEDISVLKGSHQIGFGANYLHTMQNFLTGRNADGAATINGQASGMPLADFLLGIAQTWSQGNYNVYHYRQNYIGVYAQDSWKMTARLTLNYGLRWEPYLAPYAADQQFLHFDRALFDRGVKSTVYPNAPAGLIFPGDAQYSIGNHPEGNHWNKFLPRIGLVWDPIGDGRMTVRAAFGMFIDRQHLGSGYYAFSQNPPFGNLINLTNVNLSNPWANYQSGNPFPFVLSKNITFPTLGGYRTDPFDTKQPTMNQWNLSIQKQFGADWLVTANYVGNSMIHLVSSTQLNPSIFMGLGPCTINGINYSTCSTTANVNQRRVLYLQNPADGQFYSGVNEMDQGGTGNYNGLLLSVQKRLSHGVSILANHTWSHCISDYYEAQVGTAIAVGIPGNRRALRSNCQTGDQRHVFNLSMVAQTPKFSNRTLRWIAGNWQISPIMKLKSAQLFSVTTGVDGALNGQPVQTPNIVPGVSLYASEKTVDHWLNPAAFSQPAPGTYGNLGLNSVKGPGVFQLDMAISRTFPIGEKKTLQVRGEAFNLPNHLNPSIPVSSLNSGSFGKIQSDISGTSGLTAGDPRIIQLALKLIF